jgi:hypothetical protein
VSGSIVVWDEARKDGRNYDIYGEDLSTGRHFSIASGPADEFHPAIDGKLVAWQQAGNRASSLDGSDIYVARLP